MLGWWSYCFPNTIGLVEKKCKSGHWNSSYFPSDPLSSSLKKKRGTWNLKNPRLMILQQGIWSLGGIPPTLDPSVKCTTPAYWLTCHGAYQTVPGMHNDAYPGGLSGVIPQISLNIYVCIYIYLIIEISSLQLRSWLYFDAKEWVCRRGIPPFWYKPIWPNVNVIGHCHPGSPSHLMRGGGQTWYHQNGRCSSWSSIRHEMNN